jgi:putative Mg2+ transporter-C (MgtC) family protein
MIFFAGGIGIGIGAGYYGMTTFAMLLMYIVIVVGHRLEHNRMLPDQQTDDEEIR